MTTDLSQGACLHHDDRSLWFSTIDRDRRIAAQVCLDCPVRAGCSDLMRGDTWSVHGGNYTQFLYRPATWGDVARMVNCRACGGRFEARNGLHTYCGRLACKRARYRHNSQRGRRRARANREPFYAERPCEACGKKIVLHPSRMNQRYHGDPSCQEQRRLVNKGLRAARGAVVSGG